MRKLYMPQWLNDKAGWGFKSLLRLLTISTAYVPGLGRRETRQRKMVLER